MLAATTLAYLMVQSCTTAQVPPRIDDTVTIDGHALPLRRADIADAQAVARRTNKPHNQARDTFVATMINTLVAAYAERHDRTLTDEDRAIVASDIRESRTVRRLLNLCWMPLTATGLLADLLAKPHRLAEASRGDLTDTERRLLLLTIALVQHRARFAAMTAHQEHCCVDSSHIRCLMKALY